VAQLARIETETLVLEINGAAEFPAALLSRADVTITPHLAVTLNGLSVGTHPAPVLFEERNYELIVRSKLPDLQPTSTFRDPTLIVQRTVVTEANLLALTVRFRGQVGRTSFSFRVGNDVLHVEAEIFPSKIDYVEDYEELLEDVAAVRRTLILEYLRGTYRQAQINRDEVGSGIEWLTLLRIHLGQLKAAIQFINSAARRTLVREDAVTPIHRVRGSSAGVVRAVSRGVGSGDFNDVPGIGPVRSQIQVARAFESLDTLEHRWIRSRLKFVHARLLELHAQQQARVRRSSERTGKEPPRLAAELAEITELQELVGQFLASPVISAATVDVPASVTSLQLQSAIGYAQAYQVLSLLSAALAGEDGSEQYSTSDLNELYETWCFLKVAQVTAELLGTEVDVSELIPSDATGLRFALRKGLSRSVKLAGKFVQAALAYNPDFEVPTGIQKPDVVLRVVASGGVDVMIVLDAKYRMDGSPEYVRQFGAAGAPIDAVNQLHRYRDAIQVLDEKDEPIRPVVAGVALFPWPTPADGYRLREAADEVGIGALPLLPGNDADLRAWLTSLFESLGLTVVGSDGRHLYLVG
jgi:predicted component of viral defense system (DUF524 family)